jgi:hypothetical protein
MLIFSFDGYIFGLGKFRCVCIGEMCGFHWWSGCVYVVVQTVIVFVVINFCLLVVQFFLVVILHW